MPDVIKVDKDKPLHSLIEHTEQLLDANRNLSAELASMKEANSADVAALKAQLQDEHDKLVATMARLDALDKMLPQGKKLYIGLDGSHAGIENSNKDELARFMLDIASLRLEGRPKVNCETFKLAASQEETTDEYGGFLVPPEQSKEIVKIAESYYLARKLCRVIPMAREEMRMPVKNAGLTMSWPGEAEAPAVETRATFTRPSIIAKKMVGVDTLSLEVDEDSIPVIRDYLIDEAGLAVGKEEDTQAFTGNSNGGDPFDGILFDSGVTDVIMPDGSTLFASLAYNDLVDLQDGIDEFASEQGIWLFSNHILNIIRKMSDSFGRPLAVTGDLTLNTIVQSTGGLLDRSPGSLLGRPFYRSAVMPKAANSAISTPFMIYGQLNLFAMGDRRKMSIDFSKEADFKAGNVVMRIMERVGFKLLKGSGIGRLVTAAS